METKELELTDEQLDTVVGGWYGGDTNWNWQTNSAWQDQWSLNIANNGPAGNQSLNQSNWNWQNQLLVGQQIKCGN